MSMAFENVDYTSLDIPAAPFSDPARIPDFPKNKVPRHIGVIMDGNGRWAKQRGMVRTNGHQAAEPVVFDTIAGAIEAGVRYLSLYTFSTENWKRSPQEVRFLMGFSREIIHRRVEQMDEWGVRVRWSGRRPKLWKSVIDELEAAEERTKNNKVIDVVFCINYGGRAEIADACAAIAREVRDGKISGDRVTEKMIADHLYNPDIPDCDLVIRTSGADITMVGLDVTHQCLLPQSAADRWRATGTKRGRFLADLADFSIKANLEADPALFSGGMPLHDPLAAAVALDSSLVDCFDLALRAETNTGDFNGVRGRTTGDPVGLVNHSMPHVHVALGVDSGRFLDEFVERMAEVCR